METSEVLSEIKRVKPRKLRVFTSDREEAQLVQISSKRDRWRRAIDTLDQMEWVKIEMLGGESGDAILGIITDEPDDTGSDGEVVIAANASPEERIATMVVQAQRLALENQAVMLNPLIQGYVDLTQMVMGRVAQLESAYGKMIQSHYENASLVAQLENRSGEDDAFSEAAELLGKFIQGKQDAAKKKRLTAGDDGDDGDEKGDE